MSEHMIMRVAAAAITCTWIVAVWYVFVGSLPSSAFVPTREARARLVMFMPQGWAYFTRNPREATDRYYLVDHGAVVRMNEPNTSRSNRFGIAKRSRLVGIELAAIAARLADVQWAACAAPVESCLNDLPQERYAVRNTAMIPSVCGTLLIDRRVPVPWAWSRLMTHAQMPGHVAAVEVSCDDEDRRSAT